VEAAVFALAEDDEGEAVAADAEDANADQKNPLDPDAEVIKLFYLGKVS
jgi:hypothetical protein